MLDINILRVLKHKEYYDSLVPSLPQDALHEKTRIIIKDFGRYFSETKYEYIKMQAFKECFFSFYHPKLKPDLREYYGKVLDRCEQECDEALKDNITTKMAELALATDVANLVDRYHRGEEVDLLSEVHTMCESTMQKVNSSEDELPVLDIEEILEEDENVSGLQFRLQVLHKYIRPLRRGDFVLVCGRPDTGKTTFISSEVSFLATQLPQGRPVLWLNNEGEGKRIIKRIYQSAFGDTLDDLLVRKRKGTLKSGYTDIVGDPNKIQVVDCHGWTSYQVEKCIQKINPGLVVFDMIDNINFVNQLKNNDARTDQVLEGMYQWARILGVKYDFPVIATSQVSSEAERSSSTSCYPAMHMLKDSKTGKQGAADVIIMIGKSMDEDMDSIRYISTPKNKLAIERSYIKGPVNFFPERARYEDPEYV